MNEAENDPPVQDQLLQEAAGWFARMRGPDAEASRAEFEAWLARGALHRAAYNRASEIFALGKLLDGDAEQQPRTDGARRRLRGRVALLALAAALVLFSTSWLAFRFSAEGPGDRQVAEADGRYWTGSRVIAAASPGQTTRLADGSLLRLGAGSRVSLAFDNSSRRLTLERGMARFAVAHGPRPFIVQAGGGSVTAHGTIFDVALIGDQRVSVHLIEGLVDVALPQPRGAGEPKAGPRQLRPGESYSFTAESDTGDEASSDQPTSALPPRAAKTPTLRDYDEVQLADLVAQANRGSSPPIRLATPALGERRVSGRFRIDDTYLLAERLGALFDLSIDRTQGGIMLKPK